VNNHSAGDALTRSVVDLVVVPWFLTIVEVC